MTAHFQQEHRHGQYGGDDRQPGLGLRLAVLAVAAVFDFDSIWLTGGIARRRRRRDQVGGGCLSFQIAHRGAFGGQVDLRLDHSRHRLQRPFDPAHTGCTGHVGNVQRGLQGPRRIPGIGQHLDQRAGIGGAGYLHGFRGQIDRCRRHSGGRQNCPFNARHTRGTGHALDGQGDVCRSVHVQSLST